MLILEATYCWYYYYWTAAIDITTNPFQETEENHPPQVIQSFFFCLSWCYSNYTNLFSWVRQAHLVPLLPCFCMCQNWKHWTAPCKDWGRFRHSSLGLCNTLKNTHSCAPLHRSCFRTPSGACTLHMGAATTWHRKPIKSCSFLLNIHNAFTTCKAVIQINWQILRWTLVSQTVYTYCTMRVYCTFIYKLHIYKPPMELKMMVCQPRKVACDWTSVFVQYRDRFESWLLYFKTNWCRRALLVKNIQMKWIPSGNSKIVSLVFSSCGKGCWFIRSTSEIIWFHKWCYKYA